MKLTILTPLPPAKVAGVTIKFKMRANNNVSFMGIPFWISTVTGKEPGHHSVETTLPTGRRTDLRSYYFLFGFVERDFLAGFNSGNCHA